MTTFKLLAKEAIPAALARAQHYRLLNEPSEAESICRDILAADPEHEQALITLLLALTDQFPEHGGQVIKEAQDLARRLPTAYEREYYFGLVCARWGKSQIGHMPPHTVYHWLREAQERFEAAGKLAAPDNPDAVLRWNACARILERNPDMVPKASDEPGGEGYGWDEPPGKR